MDRYTRRNFTNLIERQFPVINTCPVEFAHKMATVARLLEGLPANPESMVERTMKRTLLAENAM